MTESRRFAVGGITAIARRARGPAIGALAAIAALGPAAVEARTTRIEISSTESPTFGGQTFGNELDPEAVTPSGAPLWETRSTPGPRIPTPGEYP